jgi:hypothetical protein
MSIIEIPEILINLQEHLFSLLAFEIKELRAEKESQEYAAHTFSLFP